jgi:hypothetical protein
VILATAGFVPLNIRGRVSVNDECSLEVACRCRVAVAAEVHLRTGAPPILISPALPGPTEILSINAKERNCPQGVDEANTALTPSLFSDRCDGMMHQTRFTSALAKLVRSSAWSLRQQLDTPPRWTGTLQVLHVFGVSTSNFHVYQYLIYYL